MKRLQYILLTMILFPLVGMVSSCSDETTEEEEFGNWQERNEQAISQWASNSSFRKIKTYTKDATTTGKPSDYIYVEVLESGNGTVCPLYTDTVRVAYRTSLIPTTSYAKGLVIDQSFIGDFSWSTAGTLDGASWIDGFSTAVQNMHVGDYWRVYVPYALAYGASSSTNRPAYSNLVFEVALFDFWHPGETRPSFK